MQRFLKPFLHQRGRLRTSISYKGQCSNSPAATWPFVRWTTNNPGGTDDHFAVVHYGTNPKDLSQTAKSHIRLNRFHQDTLFRVRMDGLSPKTTYYYTVTSEESNGKGDGEESTVSHFTTPAPGELVQASHNLLSQPKLMATGAI